MKQNIGQKILHFPLTKIIVGILIYVGLVLCIQWLIEQLLSPITMNKDLKSLIENAILAISAILIYSFLFRIYEQRKISELSSNGIVRNVALGLLLGALLQSLTILVIFLGKSYSVISINPVTFLLPAFVISFQSAIFEEILFRGIIFRIIEEKLGSYISLAISALLFGAAHFANPNSSVIAALGLAIQAGLLLGSAYIYSKSLWFPIAIHFAWNFTQSGIYGAIISGNTVSESLITSKIEGPQWLTGGPFGPEGSVQATLFCLIATIVLLYLSIKQGKIIKPYWARPTVSKQEALAA